MDQTESIPADALGLQHKRADRELGFTDLTIQLARRKTMIAKMTVGFVLVGTILCVVLPVRYTASARIMPPQQAQSGASLLMNQLMSVGTGSLAAMATSGLGLKNPNDLYVGILESRPISDALIDEFGLMKSYHAKDMTEARKKLGRRTEVMSEKSGFIAVSVTDNNKERAAAMANAYVEQLRHVTNTLAVTEASRRRIFYEDQLKQAKDSLLLAGVAFQQVQQKKGVVHPGAQAQALIEGLAAQRAQVSAKEVELQGMRLYLTESNPQLQMEEQHLSAMRSEVSRLEKHGGSSDLSDMGMQDVPGASLEYLRAEHELRYRQALFDMLIRQYDAAKLDEAKDAAVIQVLEPAIPPDKKSFPNRILILTVFAIGGLIFGSLLAALKWQYELLLSDPESAVRINELKRAFSKTEGT